MYRISERYSYNNTKAHTSYIITNECENAQMNRNDDELMKLKTKTLAF